MDDYALFTQGEHLFLEQLQLKEMYLNQAKTIDK